MENLNFSREFFNFCDRMLLLNASNVEFAKRLTRIKDLHQSTTKFILPRAGRLFGNFDLGVDTLKEIGNLYIPFNHTCLEYNSLTKEKDIVKNIIYANDTGDHIQVNIGYYSNVQKRWFLLPECRIEKSNWLYFPTDKQSLIADDFRVRILISRDNLQSLNQLQPFIKVLVWFVVALSFRSTKTEYSPYTNENFKKSKFRMGGSRIALPYDSYHVLKLDLEAIKQEVHQKRNPDDPIILKRSPREHVRRAHIKRLHGHIVFIPETVVNRGYDTGKVLKDYIVKT